MPVGNGQRMGKQFRKIKRRMWIGAILRALFFGVFIGALSLAAQWMYAKRTLIAINQTRSYLLVAIPAVVCAVIVLLILMPRNKKLAARIDRRLGLHEKVQTMIALRRDTSEMAALQREDAEAALAKAPRRSLRGVASWIFFGLPLVGALAIYGSLIMPAKAVTPAPPPPPPAVWKLDVYTEQKLRDLITYVENSDMEEEPRYEVVGELEGLIIRLRSVRKESVMQESVLNTAANIHTVVSDYNTYDIIASALERSMSDDVRRLGNSIGTLKYLLINEQLLAIGEALVPPAETGSNEEITDEPYGKGATATLIAGELKAAVDRSGLSETDPLNETILEFAAMLEGVTDETSDDAVSELITDVQRSFEKALAAPLANEVVETATLERLMEIFGMELPAELVKDNAYDPSEDNHFHPEDEDKELSGVGGIGSGEVHYGSNDTIYDDVTGEYITYGEVLARYYTAVMGQMEEGTLPADLEDMLRAYFERLHGTNNDPAA